MRRWLERLYDASGVGAAGMLIAICALVAAQITLRLIDNAAHLLTGQRYGLMIPSVAEIAGFLLAAASFLALAHAFRHGAHIRVNLLLSRLPAPLRRLAEIFSLAVALGLTVFFGWNVWLMVVDSYSFGEVSYGIIAIPLWIPQAAMLAGIVVFAIAIADDLLAVLRGLPPSYERAEETGAAEDELAAVE